MTDATAGASIRFTLDGTTPSSSSMLYTGELTLSASATIQARAFKAGYNPSGTAQATYLIKRKR